VCWSCFCASRSGRSSGGSIHDLSSVRLSFAISSGLLSTHLWQRVAVMIRPQHRGYGHFFFLDVSWAAWVEVLLTGLFALFEYSGTVSGIFILEDGWLCCTCFCRLKRGSLKAYHRLHLPFGFLFKAVRKLLPRALFIFFSSCLSISVSRPLSVSRSLSLSLSPFSLLI